MSSLARGLLSGALLILAFSPLGSVAQDRISEAETLLFLTDHLKNVSPGTTLSYAFKKTGSAERGFDDTVELRVRAADGAKYVAVAFFTRERKIEFPEVQHAEGNPVLLYFLERDIREMERLTGGKSGYFRRALRMAFARSARVAKINLSFSGRETTANEVSVAPYLDDPLKDRIGKYVGKTYVFTFCADVPGGIYSVRTFVPPAAGAASDAPLIEERLTFVRSAKGT